MPSLAGGPARVVGIGPVGELVVAADHLDRPAGGQVAEGQVHGAAPVVPRPLRRVGDEGPLARRRRLPEQLGHPPGAVGVVDQQPVTRAGPASPGPGPAPRRPGAASRPGPRCRAARPGSCWPSRSGCRASGPGTTAVRSTRSAARRVPASAGRPRLDDSRRMSSIGPGGRDPEGPAVLAVEGPSREHHARRPPPRSPARSGRGGRSASRPGTARESGNA